MADGAVKKWIYYYKEKHLNLYEVSVLAFIDINMPCIITLYKNNSNLIMLEEISDSSQPMEVGVRVSEWKFLLGNIVQVA